MGLIGGWTTLKTQGTSWPNVVAPAVAHGVPGGRISFFKFQEVEK
jgi:hypothetical protein